MIKLTKEQDEKQSKMVDDLRTEAARIQEIINEVNKIIDNRLNGAIGAYNAILEEVRGFTGEVTDRMDEYVNERPEKWAETDKASAYMDWKSDWESIDLDDAPEEDLLEPFDPDHADNLENLASAPNE